MIFFVANRQRMGCASSKPKSLKKVKKANSHQVPPLHANASIKSVLSTKSALSPRKGSSRRPSIPSLEKRVSFNGVDDILNSDELKRRPTTIENPSAGYTKLRWLTKLKAVSKHKTTLRKKAEEGISIKLYGASIALVTIRSRMAVLIIVIQ